MKAFLALCLLCLMPIGLLAQTLVNVTPVASTDVVVPVGVNTAFLQQPRCYFDSFQNLPGASSYEIWLMSALQSGVALFEEKKNLSALYQGCPCSPGLHNPTNTTFVGKAGVLQNFTCTTVTPNYFQVGTSVDCPPCNVVLPGGELARFKYLLVEPTNRTLVAETNWSDPILLKTLKDPEATLGSGYAGRSASMIVITAVLGALAALLLLLLLIALIAACCCRTSKGQTYNTGSSLKTHGKTNGTRQTSLLGSLRIPTYDVHHLKSPSPYDNMSFERDTKRYTTASTLPQPTTTTTVHHNVVGPNVVNHNVVNPNVVHHNVVNPNVVNPNVVHHNVVNPNVVHHNVVNPNVVHHNVVNPNVVHHNVVQPTASDGIRLQKL